jgi:hypothetical protein
MSGGRMVECRGCSQQIKFIMIEGQGGKLKAHPVNPEQKKIFIQLVDVRGKAIMDEKGNPVYRLTRAFESHFATCPKAENFRGRA